MNREDWLTAEEAVDLTGLSLGTIYRWAREKRVRTWRPRRTRYLFREDVLRVDAEMSTRRDQTD